LISLITGLKDLSCKDTLDTYYGPLGKEKNYKTQNTHLMGL